MTDFWRFLLYSGPVKFLGILMENIYNQLVHFFAGIIVTLFFMDHDNVVDAQGIS